MGQQGNNRQFKFKKKWLVFIAAILAVIGTIIVALINNSKHQPIDVNVNVNVSYPSSSGSSSIALDDSDIQTDGSNSTNILDSELVSSSSSSHSSKPSSNTSGSSSSSSSTSSSSSSSSSTSSLSSSSSSTSSSSSSSSSTSSSSSSSSSTSSSSSSSSSTSSSSSSSSSSGTGGYRPINIPLIYLHAIDSDNGWVGLKSDHVGDAYIDGDFLRQNYIGKIENGRIINGWRFNLYISDVPATISLIVYPNQSGFFYGTQTIYASTPAFEHPVRITEAKYTENDQLKISFFVDDASCDLTSLEKISVTNSTTALSSSTSSYLPPVYDDYSNGWVELRDGQTGDAHIYGGFLGENYIGTIKNGKKINGWKINLYTHGVSISLFVYSNEYGFYYKAKQLTTEGNEPLCEWPVQITTEFTENGELIVSFFIEDYAFDLTSLDKVTIENCYEEAW